MNEPAPGGRPDAAGSSQFSAALAQSHGKMVVEDIAAADLMRSHHLAQAIGDQGWSALARCATRAPGPAAPSCRHRWFPSGKTCSGCGAVKLTLPLAESTYRCGGAP